MTSVPTGVTKVQVSTLPGGRSGNDAPFTYSQPEHTTLYFISPTVYTPTCVNSWHTLILSLYFMIHAGSDTVSDRAWTGEMLTTVLLGMGISTRLRSDER